MKEVISAGNLYKAAKGDVWLAGSFPEQGMGLAFPVVPKEKAFHPFFRWEKKLQWRA